MKTSFDSRVFSYLSRHEMINFLSDETFLKWRYRIVTHNKLDFNHVNSFNEKIQWLKLYNRREEYKTWVDKYAVKSYVSKTIGEQYIIPTIGGPWNSFDDICIDDLPSCFVLKSTHDSGSGVYIVDDKSKMSREKARKFFNKSLRKNFFYAEREWPYKFVKPQIIAEKYITDSKSGQLMDYKIHVFDGEPKLIQVDFDRYNGHKRNLYDCEWNYIDGMIEYPNHPEMKIERPNKLDEMLELSKKLTIGHPYVRADFYIANDNIYFGELTLFHGGGLETMKPSGLNDMMGSWITLPVRRD